MAPVVPTVVLVESLRGRPDRDAATNPFLKTCELDEQLTETLARRAALLRTQASRGSAVDAIVVATAEPGGTVLTSDVRDFEVLAAHAGHVQIERA